MQEIAYSIAVFVLKHARAASRFACSRRTTQVRASVAIASVLISSQAATAAREPKGQDWTGLVPTTALVLLSGTLAEHAPAEAHLIVMPPDAGLAWRLGAELHERVRNRMLEPWQTAWLACRIAATSGPHLFQWRVVVDPGPLNHPDHEPVVMGVPARDVPERTLDYRLWGRLVLWGDTSRELRAHSLDASVVDLIHPAEWPASRELPVRFSIGAPFVYGDRAQVEVRDPDGRLLLQAELQDPVAHGWDPYDETSRMPGPTSWEHGFVFLPPSRWHEPLTVAVIVTDQRGVTHRFQRVVRIGPDAIAELADRPLLVRDNDLARQLFAVLSPTAFANPDGSWIAIRLGTPDIVDGRALAKELKARGLTVGARLTAQIDGRVIAHGAFHLAPSESEVSTFRRINEPLTLDLVDGPIDPALWERGIRLEMHADTDAALRDFGTTRAWKGTIVWGLAPRGAPDRAGELPRQTSFGGFVLDPDEEGGVVRSLPAETPRP